MASEQSRLDAAVDVALGDMPAPLTYSQAWPNGYVDGYNDAMKVVEEQMRFSLLAALPVLLGEPVACMHPDTLAMLSSDTRAKHVKAERPSELNLLDGYVPLYAPDLGGGK